MGLAVSVALCTFDSAPYLDPQLRSIAAQTVPPTEVVVSDDGSRDDTLAIVERWAAEDGHNLAPAGEGRRVRKDKARGRGRAIRT